MTTLEKLSLESENTGRMILLREGMFWHLYERSAFLFVKQVKPLKPTRRFVKIAGQYTISVGLPDGSLESYIGGYERLVDTPDRIEVKSPIAVDEVAFHNWKDGAGPAVPAVPAATRQVETSRLEVALRDVDLANSTPMDCMHFVARLKLLLPAR